METRIKETSRMEAFSDGVFGFAITLLVLDIHVPIVNEGETLWRHLVGDWPTYLAFLIGFFTILICWINHHFMLDFIYRSNGKLLLINGFKLLVVTLTPFVTALLSKNINTHDQQTAVSVYAFNFTLMGMAMFFLWMYSRRNNLMNEESPKKLRIIQNYYALAAAMSLTIFLLSFVQIWLCLGTAALMFAIFLFPEKVIRRVTQGIHEEAMDELAVKNEK